MWVFLKGVSRDTALYFIRFLYAFKEEYKISKVLLVRFNSLPEALASLQPTSSGPRGNWLPQGAWPRPC